MLRKRRPIRTKLLLGLSLLVLVVVTLAGSGLVAIYSYRNLVNSLSWRVSELPVAAELSRHVGELRITFSELRGLRVSTFDDAHRDRVPIRVRICRDKFRDKLNEVKETLARYRDQLEHEQQAEMRMADIQLERLTAGNIARTWPR